MDVNTLTFPGSNSIQSRIHFDIRTAVDKKRYSTGALASLCRNHTSCFCRRGISIRYSFSSTCSYAAIHASTARRRHIPSMARWLCAAGAVCAGETDARLTIGDRVYSEHEVRGVLVPMVCAPDGSVAWLTTRAGTRVHALYVVHRDDGELVRVEPAPHATVLAVSDALVVYATGKAVHWQYTRAARAGSVKCRGVVALHACRDALLALRDTGAWSIDLISTEGVCCSRVTLPARVDTPPALESFGALGSVELPGHSEGAVNMAVSRGGLFAVASDRRVLIGTLAGGTVTSDLRIPRVLCLAFDSADVLYGVCEGGWVVRVADTVTFHKPPRRSEPIVPPGAHVIGERDSGEFFYVQRDSQIIDIKLYTQTNK